MSENSTDVVQMLALIGVTVFAILYIIEMAPFRDVVVIMLSQIAVLLALNGR